MRTRPIEVFPHSKGVHKFVFQDIIINHNSYYFCLVDGKLKTDLFNKGVIDGSKKPFPLYSFVDEESLQIDAMNSGAKWILAFPKETVSKTDICLTKMVFTGRMGVIKTYLLKLETISNFREHVCILGECPLYGQAECFKKNNYTCTKANRERHAGGRYSYA